MITISFRQRSLAAAVTATVVAFTGFTLVGAAAFPGVSLSVSKETAPPGGMAQLKIFITEPKPISTGSTSFSFDAYDEIVGIAVMSPAQDTFGVALVRGTNIGISVRSIGSSYGTWVDYPILTIVGHVPAVTPIGTKFPLVVDPAAIQLWDPFGVLYPTEVKSGHLVAGTGVAISDVSPGSAMLPAGSVVTITGTNFSPGTNIKFREAKLSEVRYVNSGRIDVVLAHALRMHGVQVKASNPDGSQATYFSYQRTRTVSPSADPILRYAVPLMPPTEVTTAMLTLPDVSPTTTYGLALQNIESVGAIATVDLLDPSGGVVATTSVPVPASRFVVRELSELFGVAPSTAWAVRVTSSRPVQVLGMAADQTNDTAMPIVAR